MNEALYFPYINLPKNAWVSQSLLYWDSVGAIVPMDYIDEPDRLDQYMRDLVQSGLVKQVIPNVYDPETSVGFARAFIDLIESSSLERIGDRGEERDFDLSRIHIDKFGYEISHYLVERGFAYQGKYPWYLVQSRVAALFMQYLALFLGVSDNNDMVPITDSPNHLVLDSLETYRDKNSGSFYKRREYLHDVRLTTLNNLLPAPANPIGVHDIVEFKEKYGHLLSSLRTRVESAFVESTHILDEGQRRWFVENFHSRIVEEIDELEQRMREKDWGSIVFGSLCGLSAAAIPTVQAIATEDLPSVWEALPGLLGALYAAYSGLAGKQKQIRDSPLAYAAYYRRRF